ncbi:MAG: 5-oxoprolinase subunit PxpA [Bacteroidota bacterium]|nr:5-oxoprolinase subunit PxpA [Bacteroidota bacterium]
MSSKQPDKSNSDDDSLKASPTGGGWLKAVDLNCDLGEGAGNDELIMPYISSANIACGYHAGDETTIWKTIELALQHKVAIGAHVSFFDKDNFGRTEMNLPADEIYDLIIQQLIIMNEIVSSFDLKMNHVKPHGALYNMSARDPMLAKTIAKAVKDFDKTLILFGLSGSYSIHEAKAAGLKTASEVFADRTYQDNGSLTLRSQPNALIEDEEKAMQQVLQMIQTGTVTSLSGKTISIIAETICIHGDGKQAPAFAKKIYEKLKQNNIGIKAI